MSGRRLSFLDRLVVDLDQTLKTFAGGMQATPRPSPASDVKEATDLDSDQRRHIAGLMRVNHSGEVCAQALYKGQALTARHDDVRESMQQAAAEEEDHLAWCEERLDQLNSHTSYLNPVWYGLSYSLGALTGVLGDRISLGFIAATEDQVCEHLESHLRSVPESDQKTRAILEEMIEDESRHSTHALDAGGQRFPWPVKKAMTAVSKVMTESAYRI